MPKLLIVDDEPGILYSLRASLETDETTVLTAPTAKLGLAAVAREKPDAVLLDLRLPDMSGLDAFDRVREKDPRLPVIIMTAHGNTDTAIEATKRGAFEYLLKPVDLHQVEELVRKAFDLRRMQATPAVIGESPDVDTSTDNSDPIIGRCPAMHDAYKAIGRVASQDVTVLILGESGTGKELVARAIYQHSDRAGKPFLAINCAAIPEALLESELFGHEKGAFTGADRKRIGKFEQADGGTLFLDEIGDMSPATQAKVLRVLQDQQFERVGGNETIKTNVRVLAATNQNPPTWPPPAGSGRPLLPAQFVHHRTASSPRTRGGYLAPGQSFPCDGEPESRQECSRHRSRCPRGARNPLVAGQCPRTAECCPLRGRSRRRGCAHDRLSPGIRPRTGDREERWKPRRDGLARRSSPRRQHGHLPTGDAGRGSGAPDRGTRSRAAISPRPASCLAFRERPSEPSCKCSAWASRSNSVPPTEALAPSRRTCAAVIEPRMAPGLHWLARFRFTSTSGNRHGQGTESETEQEGRSDRSRRC